MYFNIFFSISLLFYLSTFWYLYYIRVSIWEVIFYCTYRIAVVATGLLLKLHIYSVRHIFININKMYINKLE